MDILFYCLSDQDNQKHFKFYWAPGSEILGDCHIKHDQVVHHRAIRDNYLHIKANKTQEQGIHKGCADSEGFQTTCVAGFLAEALKLQNSIRVAYA